MFVLIALALGLVVPSSVAPSVTASHGVGELRASLGQVAADRVVLDPSFGTSRDLWIDRDVLFTLPEKGGAWRRLVAAAEDDWGRPDIADQNDDHDVHTLAGALVAVRTNDPDMRSRVVHAIDAAIGTERKARSLAVGRNLTGYVLAADLIGYDSSRFREWLVDIRTRDFGGRTLTSTHEDRPNNWGAHAGAARIAVARYLDDPGDVERAAEVFQGYLGDRDAHDEFIYGDDAWQADPDAPVAVNPPGATIDGVDVDGALVDDIRRCGCDVQDPPPREQYQWEAMQGILTQAVLLEQSGYDDVWSWSDEAIRRATEFIYERADYPPEGDDRFLPFLIDHGYGTDYSKGVKAESGKSAGFTDWTHAEPGDDTLRPSVSVVVPWVRPHYVRASSGGLRVF